jgi:tRNA (cmo5U34)-methyltransferase
MKTLLSFERYQGASGMENSPLNEKSRDEIFNEKMGLVSDFFFGEKVTSVFDDMLNRSVPFYIEIQRMIIEMVKDFAVAGSSIYDLGCSTGTTLVNIALHLKKDVKLIGIDNSDEMLKRCKEKLNEHGVTKDLELQKTDLNKGPSISNASVVLMILTLQFVRPLYRDVLVKSIYRGMNRDGCLILVEKVLGESPLLNRLFIKYYYAMKRRRGYSNLEITQKREALENVLIPYKLLENREMLKKAGFREIDVFFKWYNFCGIVAIK